MPVAANDQQEPQTPWVLISVTAPFETQSTGLGALNTVVGPARVRLKFGSSIRNPVKFPRNSLGVKSENCVGP